MVEDSAEVTFETLPGEGVDMGTLQTLVGIDVAGTLGTSVGSDDGRNVDYVSRLLKMSLSC